VTFTFTFTYSVYKEQQEEAGNVETVRVCPISEQNWEGQNFRVFVSRCSELHSDGTAVGLQSSSVQATVPCNACIATKFKAGDSKAWVMIGDSSGSCWDHNHDRQLKVPFKAT
jgi:hypothetical protein